MSEDISSPEDKRYAILSKESIKIIAEAGGHADIPENVAQLLAEDVVYRIREATQHSCQYMKHAKRKKLTHSDINRALKDADIQPVLGYGSQSGISFKQTKDADLYFTEETEISLLDVAENIKPPLNLGSPYLQANWLAVEGTQKGSVLSPSKMNVRVTKGVSEELMQYYENMTKAILGNDAKLLEVALADLRTNGKIAPVLPYFINFVSSGVKTVSHDIAQLTRLLLTVKALNGNTSLYLEPKPYLKMLVQSVLYCMLESLAASMNPLNDHWVLRDYASRLLAQIVRDWNSPVNKLRQETLKSLRDILLDHSRQFSSHYGAIVGLIAFGTQAIDDILIPNLNTYWNYLQTTLNDRKSSLVKSDAYKVHGALMNAVELSLRHRTYRLLHPNDDQGEEEESFTIETNFDHLLNSARHDVIETGDMSAEAGTSSGLSKSATMQFQHQDLLGTVLELPEAKTPYQLMSEIYQDVYEKFGDALSGRLPINHVKDFYVLRREEMFVSLADEDSHKTGDEMLQAFLTVSKEEAERRRRRYEDDDRSDRSDRSSRSDRSDSDDGISPFLGDSKVTVSTTLSDPSMGIKLKIRKLPKPDQVVLDIEQNKELEKGLVKMETDALLETKANWSWKPKRRYNYKDVFEEIDLAYKVPKVFKFKYLGNVYVQEYLRSVPTMFDDVQYNENQVKLSSFMKPVGKNKSAKVKKNLHRQVSAIHCML